MFEEYAGKGKFDTLGGSSAELRMVVAELEQGLRDGHFHNAPQFVWIRTAGFLKQRSAA
jgi:hypothetical protein